MPKYIKFFPLRHSRDAEKRLLYLIKRMTGDKQYIRLTPPAVLNYSSSAATEASTSPQTAKIVIDASEGTATTYGTLTGLIDGSNVIFGNSHGSFKEGTTELYRNGQKQVRTVEYAETAPGTGLITMVTAPLTDDVMIMSYQTTADILELPVAQTGSDGSLLVISGAVNGANTVYTLPGPYITGTLKVWENGQLRTQGSAEDWTETSPVAGTFTMATAPPTNTVITATWEPMLGGRYYEDSDGTVSLTDSGANTIVGLTFSYDPGTIDLAIQGMTQTSGIDFVDSDPLAGECLIIGRNLVADGHGVQVNYRVNLLAGSADQKPLLNTVAKTTTYTVQLNDSFITGDATGGQFDVTLPAANAATGRVFTLKKTDASVNTVDLVPAGSDTIDGQTRISLNQYDSVTVISNGSGWSVI